MTAVVELAFKFIKYYGIFCCLFKAFRINAILERLKISTSHFVSYFKKYDYLPDSFRIFQRPNKNNPLHLKYSFHIFVNLNRG